LRIDNADLRLTPLGRDAGLASDERWARFVDRRARLERNRARAESARVRIGADTTTAAQALSRPPVQLDDLAEQGFAIETPPGQEAIDRATFTAECKYRGYLKQQSAQLARARTFETRAIPADFEYRNIPGLSREIVERLTHVRPTTVGQASRVPGVTPAAVAIVAARVDRHRAVAPGA